MRASALLSIALLLGALGLGVEIGLHEWQQRRATPQVPLDPAFLRLSPLEIVQLPLAVRFDQPLGTAHGALTYNAQPFRMARHLGDDLNGIGGGNSDLGDPVYAAGAGRVVYLGRPGPGWGNMIILAHHVPDLSEPSRERVIQTVYAHLDTFTVEADQIVPRGFQIGTVGRVDEKNFAHLHFEVREGPYINPSVGYADTPLNCLSPERFLAQHRGAPEDLLNTAPVFPLETAPSTSK